MNKSSGEPHAHACKTFAQGANKVSNCLFGAIVIRRRLGGRLGWRPGWKKDGWHGFLGNPWGHFRVVLPDGIIMSYSSKDKSLEWWKQLWFQGYIKRHRPANKVV